MGKKSTVKVISIFICILFIIGVVAIIWASKVSNSPSKPENKPKETGQVVEQSTQSQEGTEKEESGNSNNQVTDGGTLSLTTEAIVGQESNKRIAECPVLGKKVSVLGSNQLIYSIQVYVSDGDFSQAIDLIVNKPSFDAVSFGDMLKVTYTLNIENYLSVYSLEKL